MRCASTDCSAYGFLHETRLTSVFVSLQGIARRRASTLFAPRVRRRTHKGTFKMVRFPPHADSSEDARTRASRCARRRDARPGISARPHRGAAARDVRVRRGVFRREAAAAPPPRTPSGCAVASRAFSSRRPREMASRWPGRDATRPRSRAHPSRVAY